IGTTASACAFGSIERMRRSITTAKRIRKFYRVFHAPKPHPQPVKDCALLNKNKKRRRQGWLNLLCRRRTNISSICRFIGLVVVDDESGIPNTRSVLRRAVGIKLYEAVSLRHHYAYFVCARRHAFEEIVRDYSRSIQISLFHTPNSRHIQPV